MSFLPKSRIQEYQKNGDGTQTITGTLIDANNTCVYLKESGQEFSLRYDQINSAKVLISFN